MFFIALVPRRAAPAPAHPCPRVLVPNRRTLSSQLLKTWSSEFPAMNFASPLRLGARVSGVCELISRVNNKTFFYLIKMNSPLGRPVELFR